jgi:flavin-dependent dehydrogenase
MDCDVAIVGAGPAAACTAIRCASLGLSVLVLGRPMSRGPAHAEPVESAQPRIHPLLARIGAQAALREAGVSHFAAIDRGGVSESVGSLDQDGAPGVHLLRSKFDLALLKEAVNRGAAWEPSEWVTDIGMTPEGPILRLRSGRSIRARAVADGSGAHGRRLSRQDAFDTRSAELLSWTGVLVPVNDNTRPCPTTPQFIEGERGWTWLANELPSRVTFTRLGLVGSPLPPMPTLMGWAPLSRPRARRVTWQIARTIGTEEVLRLGDAAARLDPGLGQGLLNALTDGCLAADTLVACVARPELRSILVARYAEIVRQRFVNNERRLRSAYAALGID